MHCILDYCNKFSRSIRAVPYQKPLMVKKKSSLNFASYRSALLVTKLRSKKKKLKENDINLIEQTIEQLYFANISSDLAVIDKLTFVKIIPSVFMVIHVFHFDPNFIATIVLSTR